MSTWLQRVEADLLMSDALTGDDEGTPTRYTVHADDVPYLIETVAHFIREHRPSFPPPAEEDREGSR